ncbi:hypothetical protein C8J56DRAFT_885133 [Mycena floridula]|nr:hypothetical protein C8J56DRAFT_885133 [Mycena floridula]
MSLRKSFSQAKFEEVAQFLHLRCNIQDPFEGWNDLDVPELILPTSVIQDLSERTMQSLVSPGPVSNLGNEAATGLFLAATFQTLVCLFGGILRDKPENVIPGTDLSSGGKIEGEIFCQEELLVFVRELKHENQLRSPTLFAKSLAQVMCELFAVFHLNRKLNKDVDAAKLIPVRACLCDTTNTYFISFDGNCFARRVFRYNGGKMGAGSVEPEDMEQYVNYALTVHQYTFSMLLEGYCSALTLYYQRSFKRGNDGDVMLVPEPPPMSRCYIQRGTTEGWRQTLELAYKSRAFLQRGYRIQSDEPAEKGLQLLNESLESWPPVKKSSVQLLLPSTVKSMSEQIVNIRQQRLKSDPEPNWEPELPRDLLVSVEGWRKLAVADFWQGLNDIYWHKFQPIIGEDEFGVLAELAKKPPNDKTTRHFLLKEVGSPYLVHCFLKELEASHKRGHWSLL